MKITNINYYSYPQIVTNEQIETPKEISNSNILYKTTIDKLPKQYNQNLESNNVYMSYNTKNKDNLFVSYIFPSEKDKKPKYNKLTNNPKYFSNNTNSDNLNYNGGSQLLEELKYSEIDKLSSTAEYSSEEQENHINQLLEDINNFGESSRITIKKELKLKTNCHKYISIEEAFDLGNKNSENKRYKDDFFVLALLANTLKIQGCLVLIEKDKPENKNSNFNSTLQYLINGIYNLKKYTFYFDFGEENNNKILTNSNFQGNLKAKLINLFAIKENEILLTNPNINSNLYSVTAIIKKIIFNEFIPFNLKQMFNYDPELNKIIGIKRNILLSGCILNPDMLESRGNNDDKGWGYNEKRGGRIYYPPIGWVGYGLNIADKYDNGDNSWIGFNNSKGEWCIGYFGIGNTKSGGHLFQSENFYINNSIGTKQKFKDCINSFHFKNKIGEGIIVTPKPEIMEENCEIFEFNGTKYKIGFMTRLNPTKIICPEGQDNYWIINGSDKEIRPYRILIKLLN